VYQNTPSGGGDLRGATSVPPTEGGKLVFTPALGARAGRSTVRARPEPTSFSASRAWGRAGAAASAVKSHLGPNRDVRNTIEARRRAESVVNHRDNRSRHHNDRGHGRLHDSDDDRDRSWSPSQRGPLAFARAFRMRGSPRVFALRPTYPGTTGTPTPVYGLRTTDSPATPGE
jgi:hypothetical protein